MDDADAQAETVIPGWVARHRFSVDAYHRIGEVGILDPTDRIELIDGQIVDLAPVGSPHIGAVLTLNQMLTKVAPHAVLVSVRGPIQMGGRSEPVPDLALLRGRPDQYRTPPLPSAADVLLIIEVSDTSLRYDREVKLPLYAGQGIPEVWIVDLAARAVDIHRNPENGTYTEVTTRGLTGTLQPMVLPDIRIPVRDFV